MGGEGIGEQEAAPSVSPDSAKKARDEALKEAERKRLREHRHRRHPAVERVLNEWWLTVQHYLSEQGEATDALNEEGYLGTFRKVYRSLINSYTPDEAAVSVANDWEVDSQGSDSIPREDIMHSIFELADVWARGGSGQAYADFLSTLLGAITEQPNGPDGPRHFLPDFAIQVGSGAPADEDDDDEESEEEEEEAADGEGGGGGNCEPVSPTSSTLPTPQPSPSLRRGSAQRRGSEGSIWGGAATPPAVAAPRAGRRRRATHNERAAAEADDKAQASSLDAAEFLRRRAAGSGKPSLAPVRTTHPWHTPEPEPCVGVGGAGFGASGGRGGGGVGGGDDG